MRALAIATIFLLSSSLVPTLAQDQEKAPVQQGQPETAPAPTQTQAVPVQPERTPQQSEQARRQGQDRADDVQVGRDWRAQPRDGDNMGHGQGHGRMMKGMGPMGQDEMAQMMDRMRMCRQMMEHGGRRMHGDSDDMDRDAGRGDRSVDRSDRDRYDRSYDEGRSSRRVKICIEDENGDEYCRYHNR